MIAECLIVGAGGAVGAVCRYLMSMVRFEGDFPLMTFLTNFTGAVIIGIVVALAAGRTAMTPDAVLFFKTGFCGGFTTFSTFSLEMLKLIEEHHFATAALYAACSLLLCIAGVWLGEQIVQRLM